MKTMEVVQGRRHHKIRKAEIRGSLPFIAFQAFVALAK